MEDLENMNQLNAGCGNSTWGTVRIDIDHRAKGLTHVMDICNIDFPDEYFNETRCISVLEHIPDWKKALDELLRVTLDKLVIEVPVNSNLLVTDLFRLLVPTPSNIRLWLHRKERAQETYHQFKPHDFIDYILQHDSQDFNVTWWKRYFIYHHYPSRCWHFVCNREINRMDTNEIRRILDKFKG